MAFSSRRGRPLRPRLDNTDMGTPELQFKRALGTTCEPIDVCLERKLITPDHHWSALHLRWLYTLRYGAPTITTRYADKDIQTALNANDTQWRAMREREYREAVARLQRAKHYEDIMRLCVFNETPAFLSRNLAQKAMNNAHIADQLTRNYHNIIAGLDLLVEAWCPNQIH